MWEGYIEISKIAKRNYGLKIAKESRIFALTLLFLSKFIAQIFRDFKKKKKS